MKKFAAVALAALMILSLTSCALVSGGTAETRAETRYQKDKKTLEENGYSVRVDTNRLTVSSYEMAAKLEDGALEAYLYASRSGAVDIAAYYFRDVSAASAYHDRFADSALAGSVVVFGDADHLISP